MKLARLEIVGFKSFADKTTLNISDGITGVVGPNGCGKSNIVDAIRWVMGEQSAKHLRGGKMEDVIFNGSESRGPMGMAEVTLTLKNDGRVPSDYASYDEIAVRRRLFRDGQSEYAINKIPVRLKDVHDLFLGTGVGTRAYSMIEQGRIGFIVNSKPEERRFLIEEVAGITKYKARKKTAQRRMEATEQNLLRVSDIVSELERQLGSLERQAKKAEKYKQLKQELRELELWWASMRFLELRAKLCWALGESERVQENAGDFETQLAAVEAEVEARRLELADLESRNAQYAEQVFNLDSRMKMLAKDLEFFAKERESHRARGVEAAKEAETLEAQVVTVQQEIAVLEEHARSLSGETETVMAELDEKETQTRALQSQRKAIESTAATLQKEMIEALTTLSNERATLQANEKRKIELEARRDQRAAEGRTLEAELAAADERVSSTQLEAERALAAVEDLRGRKGALEEQVARGKQSLSALQARLLSLKEQSTQTRGRLSSLREIERKYEGYDAGVRAVMTERQDGGVRGLVADVLATKSEHEAALEALLGPRLQDVIVESMAHGQDALLWLRSKADGRAGFLPAHVRDATRTPGPLPSHPAVLGPVLNLVQVKPGYESIARYLLGNAVLVDNLDAAVELVGPASEGYTFVTLSGDVVDSFGAMSGGKLKGAGEGLLAQKREIKELEEGVRALDAQLVLAESERTQAQAALGTAEEILQATGEALKDAEIKKAQIEKDRSVAGEDKKRVAARHEQVFAEHADLLRALETLDAQTRGSSERMTAAQAAHEEKERELARQAERELALQEQEAYAQEELTQLKVAFAQRDEKRKNVARTLERLQQNLADTEERIRRAAQAVSDGGAQATALEERIEKGKLEQQSLLDLLEEGKATLQNGRIEHERQAQALRGLEERSKTLGKSAGSLRDLRSGFDLEAREAMIQIEHLQRSIAESYDLPLEIVVSDYHMRSSPPDDAADQVSALKAQLARIGDINLTAIEEFAEVSERHQFLITQKGDLEQALTQLRSAIIKINRTSRDRFTEAYNATNAMFQKVFPRLFRGGEGRLELMMEGTDDVLESGIDIISQPPGKKLQSVQLLSGGEKALTAVSLVFSIFLIKPSPFCVLDEVDAPLDESNVARFNELLREISQVSQFICVTHSKKTMECADRLYGVTMEEPGISKLVSVDLRRSQADATAPALA